MTAIIAIVGRPNVGKSTLFNRLVGRAHAIVDDRPGITRDRREGDGRLAGMRFRIIDTAGLEEAVTGSLEDRMRQQSERAIEIADVTLLMLDARAGVTPVDKFIADNIRRTGAEVVVVANKCEGRAGQVGIAEAWQLGLGEPVALSASHGDGLVDLHDAISDAARNVGVDVFGDDDGVGEGDGAAEEDGAGDDGADEGVEAGKRKVAGTGRVAEAKVKEGDEGGADAGAAGGKADQIKCEDAEDNSDAKAGDATDVKVPARAESSAPSGDSGSADGSSLLDDAGLAADGELAPDDGDGKGDVWLDEASSQPMRVSIVGRPNMGKSTLVNKMLGEERLLTGPEAGITRDSIEVPFSWKGRDYRLVDTAGMRRTARIADKVEHLMVDDAHRAIQFSHICVLLVDGGEGLHKQDLAIARLIAEEGRGLVIGANKWDAVKDRQKAARRIDDRLEISLAQLRGVPVIHMSGKHGRGLTKMMSAASDIYELWNTRVSTGRLNRWLENMLEAHPPPLVEGRRLRIRYMTQVKIRPPTFALFVSRPVEMPESYLRYLVTGLRIDFGLHGIPVRMVMRKGENPFAGRKKTDRRRGRG